MKHDQNSVRGRVVLSGIAGAAALAAGSHGYAAIVEVEIPTDLPDLGQDQSNPGPDVFDFQAWDLDGDGTLDFGFNYRNNNSNTILPWQSNIFSLGPNQVVGYVGGFGLNYSSNLAGGTSIDGGSAVIASSLNNQIVLGSEYYGASYGGFGSVGTGTTVRGFVGLKFSIGGNAHFGWVEVEVGNQFGLIFHRAAYNDESDTAIRAGSVPGPGTLALLALGAAGVTGRKREE